MPGWIKKVEGRSDIPIDWPALKAEILGKLDLVAEYRALGVRFPTDPPSPNGKGICPCHAVGRDDQSPSAMISVKTGIYHDSGGSGDSLNFFEFALRNGEFGRWIDCLRFYAGKAGVEVPTPHYYSGGRIREGEYDYADEHGEILFRVFRYRLPNGRKSFSQHPPDGAGGWKYGSGCMDGVRLVPYRLPDLMDAPYDEPVFIVEGEKDVDRLASLGLVATCNPMGAGCWKDEFKVYLAKRECFVLPDNDLIGTNHAHQVCRSLEGVAKVVKLVELPDLPPKGDVSDWLDQGGTIEDLGRIAYEAPGWTPPPDDVPQSGVIRFANLGDVRRMLSETRWVWEGWIPSARIFGIAAYEGIGKTRLAADLCRRIYHALPWPDGSLAAFPKGSRTIWMCADAHQDELVELAGQFGLPDDAIWFPTPHDEPYGGVDIDDPDTLRMLESAIKMVKPVLVFVDTLTSATSRDLCDQRTMKPIRASMAYLAQTYGVAIALQCHLSLQGQALGRRIKGLTRTLIHLECPDQEQPERLRLWVEKSFAKRPSALGITMGDSGNEYDANPPERADAGKKMGRPTSKGRDAAKKFILDSLNVRDDRKLVDLLNEFLEAGGSKDTFFRARDELVDSGDISCFGTPKVLTLKMVYGVV